VIRDADNRIPAIRLRDVLLVPLQGEIGDETAAQLSDDVLRLVQSSGVRGLVLDITGLWMVDSHLCALLSRLAAAASLMGARTVLCGMKSDIALTLQTMGLDLAAATALTLEDALAMLGFAVVHAGVDEETEEPFDEDEEEMR